MRISDWSSDVCSSDLEQQVKRSLHACDTEKPLRSAGARQKTDIDLGQSYDRFRIIDKNAVMRRQCQFEPAAECKTIDNRNPGLPTLLYCAMHLGCALAEIQGVVLGQSAIAFDKQFQIGAGHERLLAGGDRKSTRLNSSN